MSPSVRGWRSGPDNAACGTVRWEVGSRVGGKRAMADSPAETMAEGAVEKRPYYRPTTVGQRMVLFRVYERTGSVSTAVATAHVGKSTFYYWRKRYEVGGCGALEVVGSHRPHSNSRQLASEVVAEVKAARQEHSDWGRQRIADEVRKSHDWQPVVSASQVRRILIEAGLWTKVAEPPKGAAASATPRGRSRR